MDDDNMPDYSGILESFSGLLDMRRSDDIVGLGLILLKSGSVQVEMEDESRSISSQIEECMALVAKALKKSELPVYQRLLIAIELIQTDEYSLASEILDFINLKHPESDWSQVANILLKKRIQGLSGEEGSTYHAQKILADWIEIALERSGRTDGAVLFSTQLAEEENRYLPLIKLLIRTDHKEEAVEWIQRGVKKTCQDPYTKARFYER
ncbi:MAG: hypothetical protein JXA44_08670 [Methanospirillaceae archaeon]|nr:hypothetical protein [Methanospirillaceae archaeon]